MPSSNRLVCYRDAIRLGCNDDPGQSTVRQLVVSGERGGFLGLTGAPPVFAPETVVRPAVEEFAVGKKVVELRQCPDVIVADATEDMMRAQVGGMGQAHGTEEFQEAIDRSLLEAGYPGGFVGHVKSMHECGLLGGYPGGAPA